jgi:cyanophycinase-like exopeptidase
LSSSLESKVVLPNTPGPIVLFGSGETSPSGQKIFDSLLRRLPASPSVALLETPAGFELNSAQVIGRVGEFLQHHLKNYQPQVVTVPARNRATEYSPDDARIIEPIYNADLIFMGPGSPTYAVRQLKDSLAWHALMARHRLGGAIALASAAVIAISAFALPVYEIYKVGEDLHWKPGLDFFGMYGLPLVFIPHWNNNEGGDDLDTSRCFMGMQRFSRLVDLLPPDLTLIGIDEKTGLVIDPQEGTCQVIGAGGVTLIHTGQAHQGASPDTELQGMGLIEVAESRRGHVHTFGSMETFSLSRIGQFHLAEPGSNLPSAIWQKALSAIMERERAPEPPPEVLRLVEERQEARLRKDWSQSDSLRQRIRELGWQVKDTPEGVRLEPGKGNH